MVRAMNSEARVQRLLTENKAQLKALIEAKVRADQLADEAGKREQDAVLREWTLRGELADARDEIKRLRTRR